MAKTVKQKALLKGKPPLGAEGRMALLNRMGRMALLKRMGRIALLKRMGRMALAGALALLAGGSLAPQAAAEIKWLRVIYTGLGLERPAAEADNAAAARDKARLVSEIRKTARGDFSESAIPQSAKESARALVKIITDTSEGTGFAVQSPGGKIFIATAAHVIYDMLKKGRGALIEDISGNVLQAAAAAVDIKNDIALLEAPGWNGPHLPISDFAPGEPAYVLGFPGDTREKTTIKGFESGRLQYLKARGAAYYRIDSEFILYSSFSNPAGASGAPLLNEKGAVVGTLSSGGSMGTTYAMQGAVSKPLTELLKTAEKKLPENDRIGFILNSMKKLSYDITPALQKKDGWTAAQFYRFAVSFMDPSQIRSIANLAIEDEDALILHSRSEQLREEGNQKVALAALRLSAAQGYGPAMFDLGKTLLEKEGAAEKAEGLEHIRKAAALQNPSALAFLAEFEILEMLERAGANGLKSLKDWEAANLESVQERVSDLSGLAAWGFKPAEEALKRLQPVLFAPEAAPGGGACRQAVMAGA